MKKIGFLKGIRLCSSYSKLNQKKRECLQKERLEELIKYARENSPYYKELYKDIHDQFQLSELPPVNKLDLMNHFDEWLTVSNVKLIDIEKFMENKDNIGRKFSGKYIIFTTSGSTGNPLVTLCDSTTNNIMGAINALRSITRKEDMKSYIKHGGKTMGVFATGGFYLGNSSVRSRLLAMPWKKRQMGITSSLIPVDQIVSQLNDFQPSMLGGYPTILDLLIEEQMNGRLHIHPVLIMTGGEYLSDELRDRLSHAFHCYVQTSYGCTEGGTVACECSQKHFHINDDWLIVEPVDQNNNPVPDGVQADKFLLTNLFNYTQPFIRYEITDRIVMHHEPCSCLNPSPWITIEGRTDDVTSFKENKEIIRIAPLAIYPVLKEIKEIRRFQVLVYPENKVALRLIPTDGHSKEDVFSLAKCVLSDFLKTHGIHTVTITLDESNPKQLEGSGKFKHIINCCK